MEEMQPSILLADISFFISAAGFEKFPIKSLLWIFITFDSGF